MWFGGTEEIIYFNAVHFSSKDVFLWPSLRSTEELPNSSLVQKWHKQGKKGGKIVSPPLLPEWCQSLIKSPTSYDYAMTIIFIQEVTDFPRSKEPISPASSSLKSRITLVAGGYSYWTRPLCLFHIQKAQHRDKGSPEPLETLLRLNVIKMYQAGRELIFSSTNSAAELSCSLFCCPRITMHPLVFHILVQWVP